VECHQNWLHRALTPEQQKWNAKARNAIIEDISDDIFARIDNIDLAHDMWLHLIQLHEGSSKVREQKYHLVRAKYDEFKMLLNECCNDMFSHLNFIVKEFNSLNVSNLDKGMINRKILMLLSKPKYNIINSMFQKEDLDKMEVVELIGEIRAHEICVLDISEKPTTSNSIAFKVNVKKTPKLKMIKHETSSSEQEDSHERSSSDEDDDKKLELLMRKFSRLNNKIGKKDYSFDPKKGVFHPSGSDKIKTCYNCGEKGHISPNYFKPVKKRSFSKTNKYKNQVMMSRITIRVRTRAMRRKRAIIKRPSSSERRKGKT
jgi:hypothetical protein